MTIFFIKTRNLFLFPILILVLLACQIPSSDNPPTATQTFTATLPPTLSGTATPAQTGTATETPAPTITPTPAPLTRRVLILSIDGLRPDAISLAPMPNLLALMQSGAYSLSAQT